MSIGAQTAAAIGRALLIATLALAASGPLSVWLAAQAGRRRTLAWGLLLTPFFTPALLVSYAFSRFALALVLSPWSHEALYIGVLALKLIPVAVILRMHLPSPLSAEAWHIYRASSPENRWRQMRFRLRGAGEGPWVAGGLVFLLAFADFELASLWNIHTWTMGIFDAQTGGLALSATLRLAAGPLIVALAVVTGLTLRSRRLPWVSPAGRPSRERWPWGYLGLSATIVSFIPLGIVFGQAVAGLPNLVENFVLGPEIGVSLFVACSAALLADIGVRMAQRQRAATLFGSAPGLLGALTVSLLMLALFQLPGLHLAYNTPLPLVLTLAILAFPLGALLSALRPPHSPALHIARQIGHRRLLWDLETRPHLMGCGLLFCWAYFDFTASSILAPVGFTPVFVRLHNLAHYGQTAVLSAMMLAAFAAPVVALILAAVATRFVAGRK